jgi:hypothetical protein
VVRARPQHAARLCIAASRHGCCSDLSELTQGINSVTDILGPATTCRPFGLTHSTAAGTAPISSTVLKCQCRTTTVARPNIHRLSG